MSDYLKFEYFNFLTSFLNFKLSPTNFLDFSGYQLPVVLPLFYYHFLKYTLTQQQLIPYNYFRRFKSIDTLAHLHIYSVVGLKIGYYWYPNPRLNHWARRPFSNMRKLTCAFDLLSDSACLKAANLSDTLVSISCLYLNSSVRFSWCWLDLKKELVRNEYYKAWILQVFTGFFTLSLYHFITALRLFYFLLFSVFDSLLEEIEKRKIHRTDWHLVIRFLIC